MAIVHVTSENYEKEVLQSDKPVLIDFWASWCGPCQMLGPVIEEVSEEVTDVKFVKVSTEEAPELAEKFSIMYIPTLVRNVHNRKFFCQFRCFFSTYFYKLYIRHFF